jgi:hypothetical protein
MEKWSLYPKGTRLTMQKPDSVHDRVNNPQAWWPKQQQNETILD